MKKFLAVLLILLCIPAMTACKTDTPSDITGPTNQTTFIAKVLELRGDICLARPVNSEEMREVFLVEVPCRKLKLSLGNYISVTCDAVTPTAVKIPLRIDNADVTRCDKQSSDIPQLKFVPLYTAEQLSADMKDIPVAQVRQAWGNPYGTLSDMVGDMYYTDMTRQYEAVIYYKFNGTEEVVSSVQCKEVPDAPTITQYKYDGNVLGGEFIITLYSDGKFQYSEGPLSSYNAIGQWSRDTNGVLCLYNIPNDGPMSAFVRKNCFTVSDNQLTWIAAESNGFMYTNVKNGDTWTKLS